MSNDTRLDELAEATQQAWQGQAARTYATSHAYPPCPVCGYRGKPERKAKGSVIVLIVLLLVGLLPGLLYALLCGGHVYRCAHCEAKRADA